MAMGGRKENWIARHGSARINLATNLRGVLGAN